MKYLLDTHTVLWLAENSPKLPKNVASAILNTENNAYVSIVSAWEVALKCSIDKLRLTGGVSGFFDIIAANGFDILPIKKKHLEGVQKLPFIHRDPFDRMLVAVAKAEHLAIVTADENIKKYQIESLW